jgi:putative DNA methylase
MAVPKAEELVATPYRHGSRGEGRDLLPRRHDRGHAPARRAGAPGFPVTIYYAFKQSESGGEEGTTNTGWDTFLAAVIEAGFAISGTWPMRTERNARSIGIGTNALASSIVLVCRPRPANALTATRREFLNALKIRTARRAGASAGRQHRAGGPGAGGHRPRHGGLYALRQGARRRRQALTCAPRWR